MTFAADQMAYKVYTKIMLRLTGQYQLVRAGPEYSKNDQDNFEVLYQSTGHPEWPKKGDQI